MASNGKWVNPAPSQVDKGTGLALQSLTSYLGGWQEWTGSFDLSFTPAGYVLGNASRWAEYKLQGDECTMRFEYLIGNTTVFPVAANAFIRIKIPFTAAATGIGGFQNVGRATATDVSTGQFVAADVYTQNGFGSLAQFYGPATASANTFHTQWIQNAGGSWPFLPVPGGAQVAWAVGDSISGQIKYRIQV